MEKKKTLTLEEKTIQPFEVTQALIGLELDGVDDFILKYLNFFTQKIPTTAAYFMHVLPDFAMFDMLSESQKEDIFGEYSISERVVKELENKINLHLSNKEQIYVEYDMKEGDPLEELLLNANELKADLVVIGKRVGKGHHGILAKKLARKTKGNALVIPENSKLKMNTILVPVDFSENSSRALRTALGIKKQVEKPVRIVALNVYQLPNFSSFKIDRPWAQFQSIVERNIKDAFQAFLNSYTPGFENDIEVALKMKDVPGTARYIYNYAKEVEADLMIVGAKGHSRVELMMMGSVTEKLMIRNDSIPTLIIK